MKWGTPDHPKTSNLCGHLKIGVAQAVGHLELLWHWVSKYRADGSLEGLEDHSIAAACRWEGDASLFVRALERARWIDLTPMRRVHGWSEHAENAVHSSLARVGMLFCDGTVPKVGGLDGKNRERERASARLAEVKAQWDAAASLPAESPWSPRGESKAHPRLAVAVALETSTEATTAPPSPRQKPLALGPVAVPPKRLAAEEERQALLTLIYTLCEITGADFTEASIAVTSFKNGKGQRVGTVRIDDMTPEYASRSIKDARRMIGNEIQARGLTRDQVQEAEHHAEKYAESHMDRARMEVGG